MWLGHFAPSQVNTLGFWFATEHRWLRGRIHTVHRRLIDALNAEADQVILVENAAPHDLNFRQRRDPAARAGVAIPNVLFCVPIEDAETPAASRDPHAWVLKTPERVELGVGPFEIDGILHLPEGSRLQDTLGVIRHSFLALTEVEVRRTDGPRTAQRYPVAIVNGRRVEYVIPAASDDPALAVRSPFAVDEEYAFPVGC